MLVIRNIFTAKPGKASALAAQLHAAWHDRGYRVFTDAISDMNTVVLEIDVKDLADYETQHRVYTDDPKIQEAMKGYTDLYLTGRREILKPFTG